MNKLHFILLGVAIVIAVIFLSFSSERMRSWQSGYLRVSNPALQAGSAISGQVEKLQKGLKTLDELEAENAALVASNNELRAASQLVGGLESENKRLRASLDYRERSAFKLLPAQIVSRDASSWWNTAKINRGFGQEVDTAQPVLTADGLVGRTTTVSKEISIVLSSPTRIAKWPPAWRAPTNRAYSADNAWPGAPHRNSSSTFSTATPISNPA